MFDAIPASYSTGVQIVILVTAFSLIIAYAYYRHNKSKRPYSGPDEQVDEVSEELVDAIEAEAATELEPSGDREKLPREHAVLLLLEVADDNKIEGHVRLQKLIFLLQEEWDDHSDEPYPFEKYEFQADDY